MGKTYIDKFLNFKCCPDVLGICSPIEKFHKEITESMSILEKLRSLTLEQQMKYNIVDLCAGNALTSVLIQHILPVTNSIAIDIRERNRKWHKVRKFEYINLNIHDDKIFDMIDENSIIISIHPCSQLAKRCIEIFNNSEAKKLVLMPCCKGGYTKEFFQKYKNFIKFIPKNAYVYWSLFLSSLINEEYNPTISRDNHCLSDKNIIIEATRK